MVFLVQNKKSEQYHLILHTRISLVNTFHLKLTILIFWTKFAKMVFRLEKEKIEQHH